MQGMGRPRLSSIATWLWRAVVPGIWLLWFIVEKASTLLSFPELGREMSQLRESIGIGSGFAVLLFFACISIFIWSMWPQLRRKWKGEVHIDACDMGAKEVADYVMTELGLDLPQANQFVERMYTDRKITTMRAVKRSEAIDSLVPADIFENSSSYNRGKLHLVGTDRDRNSERYWGLPFHENGWISSVAARNVRDYLLYSAPRFAKNEIKSTVSWYQITRPKQE